MGKNSFYGYFLCFFLVLVFGCKESESEVSAVPVVSLPVPGELDGIFRGGINYSARELSRNDFIEKDRSGGLWHLEESVEEEVSGERVFQVEFLHLNEEDLLQSKFTGLDYSESVRYLSSQISSDFFLVTSGRDTVVSSGVIFERNFKVAPYNRVLVFFSGIKDSDVALLYNDRLFGNGQILFNKHHLKL